MYDILQSNKCKLPIIDEREGLVDVWRGGGGAIGGATVRQRKQAIAIIYSK